MGPTRGHDRVDPWRALDLMRRQIGGCITPKRAAPAESIDIELIRARARASAPPSGWELSDRVLLNTTVNAEDDHSFVIDQVLRPAR
jgi:hypothetical protein